MSILKKIGRIIVNFFEYQLPSILFIIMFVVFLLNIISRTPLFKTLTWTNEASVNLFAVIGLLVVGTSLREEDHVVFDMVYNKLKPLGQCIFRIISAVLIIIFFGWALPGTLQALVKTRSMTSILRIPNYIIFSFYPLMLICTIIRMTYRLILDIKALICKAYKQSYNAEEKEGLI